MDNISALKDNKAHLPVHLPVIPLAGQLKDIPGVILAHTCRWMIDGLQANGSDYTEVERAHGCSKTLESCI